LGDASGYTFVDLLLASRGVASYVLELDHPVLRAQEAEAAAARQEHFPLLLGREAIHGQGFCPGCCFDPHQRTALGVRDVLAAEGFALTGRDETLVAELLAGLHGAQLLGKVAVDSAI